MPATHDTVIFKAFEESRLKRLWIARTIGAFVLLTLFAWFTYQDDINQPLSMKPIIMVWLLLTLAQWIWLRRYKPVVWQLLFYILSDCILLGLLIYASGGIASPLVFLLGVIIIIAGAQARVLLVLSAAVLASITYLISIYTYAHWQHVPLRDDDTLKILLQTSLFFLAGGIMALIAKRHASLQHEQRITTKQHQQLRKLHAQVLQSMQEGIVILSDKLLIHDFNPAASKMLSLHGWHIGTPLTASLHVPQAMLQFTQQTKHDTFQVEIQHHEQYLLTTLTRLHDKQAAWLMTMVNITQTRALERKLAKQDKLASLGQMAAMLAHEIRNPMQSIAQAVELMGLEQPNNALERIVTDEITRLNRLVSDMLDYASPLQPHVQHVSIPDILNTAIAHIDVQQQYDIQLHCPDIHLNLDPDHFRLVADNLIRNAVQASPEPGSVSIVFAHDSSGWQLRIQDQGDGINPDIQKQLFEPFQTGRKQGTGLGLATVWQVCQINGWDIALDTHVQQGTCFVVSCESKPEGEHPSHGKHTFA